MHRALCINVRVRTCIPRCGLALTCRDPRCQPEEVLYDANPVAGSEEVRVSPGPPRQQPQAPGRHRVGAKIASLQQRLQTAQENTTSQVQSGPDGRPRR